MTIQETLKELQLRLSANLHRRLTYADLAQMAHASPRALGEWMRGEAKPPGMAALMYLLARLPPDQLAEVLNGWRSDCSTSPGPQAPAQPNHLRSTS